MDPLKNNKKKVVIVFFLIVGLVLGSWYTASRITKPQEQVSPSVSPIPSAVRGLVETIHKKANLPKDETPNVATITDITKLAGQPFFANAKNGDKVLIYTASQKAILYRPATGEVIQESPIEVVQNENEATTTATLSVSDATGAASISPVLKIKF